MLPAFRFKKKERSCVYKRTADLKNQRELNLGSIIGTEKFLTIVKTNYKGLVICYLYFLTANTRLYYPYIVVT